MDTATTQNETVTRAAPRATPVRRFLEALAAGRRDEDNVRAALRLTSLVHASYRSLTEGRTVPTTDPVR